MSTDANDRDPRIDNNPVPTELFHYTTRQGLIGIISEGVIRAGHAAFMNDASETAYASSLMKEVREELGVEDSHIARPVFPFFVSFSAEGDLLSQCQAYGENGSGYSICFDLSPLGHIPTSSSIGPGEPSKGPVLRLKNPAFSSEKEWRLFVEVATDDTPALEGRGGVGVLGPEAIKFNSHPSGLKPYVELGLSRHSGSYTEHSVTLAPDGNLPITKIICGSKSSSSAALDAVRLLLRSKRYRDDESTFHYDPRQREIEVMPSAVPLA